MFVEFSGNSVLFGYYYLDISELSEKPEFPSYNYDFHVDMNAI